jgi:ribosomal protein S18 acetylase RimI-like enzyme
MNFSFSHPNIMLANNADIPAIKDLLNSAYRGEASKKGWTTEADLIAGDVRTDENNLAEVLAKPDSVFLKFENAAAQLVGCVNLQKHADRIYLGMFSVSPDLQGGGVGKGLLYAAEEYAKQTGCRAIYMYVISLRTELIAWYVRNGYADTNERVPFNEDGLTGKHMQKLEFMVLEKAM